MTLNYRYQLQTETNLRPAIAPRVSLVLPLSNHSLDGIGEGSFGYELMLPVSKIVTDRITLNFNAGLRSMFDVAGHQPTIYRLGGSAIYAVTRDTNFAGNDWRLGRERRYQWPRPAISNSRCCRVSGTRLTLPMMPSWSSAPGYRLFCQRYRQCRSVLLFIFRT